MSVQLYARKRGRGAVTIVQKMLERWRGTAPRRITFLELPYKKIWISENRYVAAKRILAVSTRRIVYEDLYGNIRVVKLR